jgi:hypothetical protein
MMSQAGKSQWPLVNPAPIWTITENAEIEATTVR